MLCVEDAPDGLNWAESIGGLPALLIERSEANLKVVSDWVAKTDWIDFLAKHPVTRSNTSICLKIIALVQALTPEEQTQKAKELVKLIDNEESHTISAATAMHLLAYDFGAELQ